MIASDFITHYMDIEYGLIRIAFVFFSAYSHLLEALPIAISLHLTFALKLLTSFYIIAIPNITFIQFIIEVF